jgi:hypothetical protein
MLEYVCIDINVRSNLSFGINYMCRVFVKPSEFVIGNRKDTSLLGNLSIFCKLRISNFYLVQPCLALKDKQLGNMLHFTSVIYECS